MYRLLPLGNIAEVFWAILRGRMAGEKQAFTGRHVVNRKLTGPGSEKDTRHHEIAIETAGVHYLPGDALGVIPHNAPALVDRIVAAIGARGDEPVPAGTPGAGAAARPGAHG